jgi:hypothetical protein
MSLRTCLSNTIEIFLCYLCTLVMSSISSITEIVNISFVLGHVEEAQMNESLVRVYLSSCIVVICTRVFRNMCYLLDTRQPSYWVVTSMTVWFISCLFYLGTGIAVLIVHGVSPVLIVVEILIWLLIFVMSHFIDLVVIGIKAPTKRTQLTERQECFICMEEYTNSIQLDCGHHVHQECLEKWALQGQPNCPLCRSEIV